MGVIRDDQLIESAHLLGDVLAQLGDAVVLSGGDSAAQEANGEGTGHLLQEPMAIDLL
jgi:hypothetical protein